MEIAEPRRIVSRRDLAAAAQALREQDLAEDARRARLTGIVGAAVTAGRDEIRRRFEKDHSGRETVREHAFLVDQVLAFLFDEARREGVAGPAVVDGIAVVAVGGYGRAELCPHSDIDLLFLTDGSADPQVEAFVQFILYVLWDLGFTVGHAVRSADQCLASAREDWTVATNMLDARFVYGDQRAAAAFRRRLRTDFIERKGRDFLRAKLAERDERHERMGDSRYMVEPNLKEGKGGLRDLQLLGWIAKFLYGTDDFLEEDGAGGLVGRGLLSRADLTAFRRSLDFLLTVRCALHYEAGRAEDRLTFDLQPALAGRLGYQDRAGANRTERFMKHYFFTTKRVGELMGVFLAGVREERAQPSFLRLLRLPPRRIGAFAVRDGQLSLPDPAALDRDPLLVMRTFQVACEHGLALHPGLRAALHARLRAADALRADPEAGALFLDILASENDCEPALREMSGTGVLNRFVPDFGRVVAQTQHDMYHVYTVDEHTIRAVGILSALDRGEGPDDLAHVARVAAKVQSRRVLYLALFLHDIAKGRGGDHSLLGADVARATGPRLGLDGEDTETAAWLVEHHLYLSRMAFKRDVGDPKTVSDIVEHVQSPERLRLLYVLTACDISAVGPSVWTAWKANLLETAFEAALAVMSGASVGESTQVRIEEAQAAFRRRLGDWPEKEVDAFVKRTYPTFWVMHDPETLARAARIVRGADAGGRSLAVDWHPLPGARTAEILVYAPDHQGLFARVVSAITLAGAGVADAKILTTRDGMALDVFVIEPQGSARFDDERRLRTLAAAIEKFIVEEPKPDRMLAEIRPRMPSRTDVFQVPPRVLVDNEASRSRTVIEINARDRPGLLLTVSAALLDLGLSVSTARVTTYGEKAVDVFYVQTLSGMKLAGDAQIERVRERLLEVLSGMPGSAEAENRAA